MDNLDLESNQGSFEGGISLDLLEQHQAQEQARLLKKFKELREWQQQQQQQLMRQQQQQLMSLQTEHSKVQSLLATQRGPESNYQGALRSGSPILTPPAKNAAIASRVNQLRPKNQFMEPGVSLDSGLVMSMQDTLKSQNSLPKPVMYINPLEVNGQAEDDKYTNSELFSNFDPQDDHRILEDENKPAQSYPDWMSDTSENFLPPKLPPPRPLKSQLFSSGPLGNREHLAGLEELLNTAPPALLHQVLSLLPGNMQSKAPAHEVEKSASPTLPVSAVRSQNAPFEHGAMAPGDFQVRNGRREERHIEFECVQNTVFDDSSQRTQLEINNSVHANGYGQNADSDNNSDNSDSDVQELSDSMEEDENFEKKVQGHEQERPIQGTQKSFQQLLEEQLKSEEPVASGGNALTDEQEDRRRAKPFLRKGEGIARFNSAPERRPKSHQTQKDRNKAASSRADKDVNVERISNQAKRRVQTMSAREKDDQSKDAASKQLPPAPRKVQNLKSANRPEPEVTSKPSTHLSIIHSAALRKKEMQKVREEDGSKSAVASTPFLTNVKGHLMQGGGHSNYDQSPSIDGISNATDEQDMTELDSLAEFELLEDAADNMSFCSNSSLVKKLVCMDQKSHKEAVKKLKTLNEVRKGGKEATLSHSAMNETALKGIQPSGNTFPVNENKNVNNSNFGNCQTLTADFQDFSSALPQRTTNGYLNGKMDNGEIMKAAEDKLGPSQIIPEEYFGFSLTNASDQKAMSSSISPSQIPRAFYLNQEEAAAPSTPSSAKAMTRKVASISSKFTEANDTLTLLKSLSQKAGLLTSDSNARLLENKGQPTRYFSNTQDNVFKTGPNLNTAFSDITQSNTVTGQLKNLSVDDPYQAPSQVSQVASFNDLLKPSFMPNRPRGASQLSDDNNKGYFPGTGAFDHQKDKDQLELTSMEEEDDDEDEDDEEDAENEEDNESGTCESSDDEVKMMATSSKDKANAVNTLQKPTLIDPFRQFSAELSKANTNRENNKFNDETEWSEEEADGGQQQTGDMNIMKGNVPQTSKMPSGVVQTGETVPSSPPTSGLVTKLFPKLKPQQAPPVKQVQDMPANENTDGIQSRVLRDKLKELDHEIERFRSENARLNKLRREREEGLEKLKQGIKQFQKEKEEEMKRFEDFRIQETKKLKREKKQFDTYQKKMRSMPARKEKEEIDALNGQLEELQDELKRKETRWTSSTARLKNRIAELELENGELKEEIRILEKKRLEWMTQAKLSKSTSQNSLKSSSEGAIRLSTEMPHQAPSGPSFDKRDNFTEPNRVSKVSSNPASTTSVTTSAVAKMQTARRQVDPNKGIPEVNGKMVVGGIVGDGIPIQNNFVPVMAENTLLKQNGMESNPPSASQKDSSTPVASSANGLILESLQSSDVAVTKSAAVVAMEKPVIDKGNVLNCKEIRHKDGKLEKVFETGAKEIRFPNGTVKEISSDGQTIVCRLANGDIRQIFPDHRVVYIFAEAQIMQTSFPDGLEIFHFKNGQIEKRYPDGTVEITFPSKDIKYLFPDGGQEVILTDGTVMQYSSKGERTVEYPSGDREVHTAEYQRREFPDGIVKTIYSDGRHETRFPNGRVRLRDKAGNIIMDQICPS